VKVSFRMEKVVDMGLSNGTLSKTHKKKRADKYWMQQSRKSKEKRVHTQINKGTRDSMHKKVIRCIPGNPWAPSPTKKGKETHEMQT